MTMGWILYSIFDNLLRGTKGNHVDRVISVRKSSVQIAEWKANYEFMHHVSHALQFYTRIHNVVDRAWTFLMVEIVFPGSSLEYYLAHGTRWLKYLGWSLERSKGSMRSCIFGYLSLVTWLGFGIAEYVWRINQSHGPFPLSSWSPSVGFIIVGPAALQRRRDPRRKKTCMEPGRRKSKMR